MADPQPEVRDIFCAALDRENPQHRAEYLDQACQGNPELRARIEALLRAHDEASGFLQDPSGGVNTTIDQPAAEAVGTVIGSYKLIEQIGEGGMGTVWMAQQTEPVKRLVALKLIKAGMDSKQVIARFEAERQALALMDHPNIAKVFDGGATPSGRPYFVMELVKGVPITDFCDQNHLTPRQRLELFLSVCQAVQHAHQKGIIHRDLKPSNVLVSRHDTTPVVKVIDFGVAKALGQELTDKTLFTGVAQMLGTPLYMSPEQAGMSDLDVDTRSDIYSLGVLLYELLAGTTPFDKERFKRAGYDEIRRIIREEEPPRPSTRLSTLGEDAATVSANRESDPRTLSRLLRGELDWVVMKALEKDRNRRYETANGFAMDVQRYLADEAVLACPPSALYRFRKFARRNKVALAFAGLVLVILLTAIAGIGWNVRDRAARQASVEQQVSLALQEAERLQEQAKWPEALSAVKRAEGLLAGGGSDELRERVRQLRKDLDMILRLDAIRLERSAWQEDKFDHAGAVAAYAQAFRDYGVDLEQLPTDEAVRRLKERAHMTLPLALAIDDFSLSRFGAFGASDAGRLSLITVARGLDADSTRDRLRALFGERNLTKHQNELRMLAESVDVFHQAPATLGLLSSALHRAGLRDLEQSLLQQAQRRYPDDFWINFELAHSLGGSKDREGAVRYYTAAVAIRPSALAARVDLGNQLLDQKRLAEAEACYRRVIELDPSFWRAQYGLGTALYEQGKLDEAESRYRSAIKLNPNYSWSHNNLALLLRDQKKLVEAEAHFRRAIELDPTDVKAHMNLGILLHDQKRLVEAEDCYASAMKLKPNDAVLQYEIGGIYYERRDYGRAICYFRKAIESNPAYGCAHSNLGSALLKQGKIEEATAEYKKAMESDSKNPVFLNNLGLALQKQKKPDEAIVYCRAAIAIDPKYANPHNTLGMALRDQGKIGEAIVSYHKAIELDPNNAHAHSNLGHALSLQGKFEEAIASYRQAIAADPKYAAAHGGIAHVLSKQNKLDDAISWYRKALAIDPKDSYARDGLADALSRQVWRLTSDPDPTHRDPQRAREAIAEVVKLAPGASSAWQCVGWAQYRLGNWRASIEALEKSCKLQPGGTGDSGQWIVLALAHAKLAAQDTLPEKEREHHKMEARRWYEEANKLIDQAWRVRPAHEWGKDIWDFREEARALLGEKESKK